MRTLRSGWINANASWIGAILSSSLSACSGGQTDVTRTDSVAESAPPTQENLNLAGSSNDAPEAGTIVFRSDRDQEGIGDLYVMAADGSNVRRLTNGGDYNTPIWAPNGGSIAFRRVDGLEAVLGLLAPQGEEPVVLVTGEDPELWDRVPAWSGGDLIYASRQEGRDTDLWAVSRSGGQRRAVFSAPLGTREEADLVRASSRLAFTWNPNSEGAGHGEGEDQDLWVADGPDDPAPENLTEGRVYVPSGPRWSPDGERIAFWGFARTADGGIEGIGTHSDGINPPDAELFLIDVSTHELTRLTDNAQDDLTPSWTPDGKELIVTSWRDGEDDIWRLPVDAPEQAINLTEDGDAPRSDSAPDCFWGVPAK